MLPAVVTSAEHADQVTRTTAESFVQLFRTFAFICVSSLPCETVKLLLQAYQTHDIVLGQLTARRSWKHRDSFCSEGIGIFIPLLAKGISISMIKA